MDGLEQRELIAYAIIGVLALAGFAAWALTRRRRKLDKLRRRGIKTHGH